MFCFLNFYSLVFDKLRSVKVKQNDSHTLYFIFKIITRLNKILTRYTIIVFHETCSVIIINNFTKVLNLYTLKNIVFKSCTL